jgi:Cu/Ag efflux protein CusF
MSQRGILNMIVHLYRPLVMGLLPTALIACMNPGPTAAEQDALVPLGVDLGGSGPVAAPAQPQPGRAMHAVEGHASRSQHSGEMQMAHAGHSDAHGTGTVNSVDPAQHKVNLSHQPIPDIGWPAMTMDFPAAPSVDLKTITPGMHVNFTIEQGQGGIYEIRSIVPAGDGR